MDGVKVFWRKRGGRLAALVLGLSCSIGDLGCSRVNSFLRDEPPLLGTIDDSQKAGSSRASTAATGKTATAPAERVATSRTSPANDRYAQSFNRTRPRQQPSSPGDDQASPTEAAPPRGAASAENGVRTTALDTPAGASSPSGVLLKAPVPMHPAPDVPAEAVEPLTAPQEAPALPSATPPEASRTAPETAESLVAGAQKRLESLESYQVDINRQERVGGTLQAAEDVVLSIRRNPRAVRLEWQDGPHQGREVIFAEKETGGLLQVNMADSRIPMPRLSLPPDSPLALSNSRHPITEAGFDTIVGNLQKTIDENRAGDLSHGRIAYTGIERAEPLDRPCHKITRVTASGETWQIFFDPETRLPTLVQANGPGGELVERYVFRNVRPGPPELATADAFNPQRRWGEPKGVLQRLAGATQTRSSEPAATR
jgi:hypothetical protein